MRKKMKIETQKSAKKMVNESGNQVIVKRERGITLIALVVTIIILLILATVTIQIINGGGLFTHARKASFYQEMSALEEKKDIANVEGVIAEIKGEETNSFIDKNFTSEELKKLPDTLKAEMVLVRNSLGNGERITTSKVWKDNLYECNDVFENETYLEGLTENIYYISEKDSGKKETYLYDGVSNMCFKIPQTKIGKYVVHSLPYAKFILDGVNGKGIGTVYDEAGIKEASDGTKCYEPDLNSFSHATEIVYYAPDMKTEYTMPIDEFLEKNKPNTVTVDGQTYTFADYTKEKDKRWANIKTTANGLDGYWVWIPRYAYKLNQESQNAEIVFVDINNVPMNEEDGSELSEEYTVHEAFNQGGHQLKGIWFSKYQPTSVETVPHDSAEPEPPDLSNFEVGKTEIVYYTEDAKESITREYTGNTPERKITEGGKDYYFYNYESKMWANIKTTANDLDSWWVWIPRFAYKLESGTSSIILIDENDKPIDKEKYGDTLPNGYRVHEAFNQGGHQLKGIWFSKYRPTAVETALNDSTEPAPPDLSNFVTGETKIVYYTQDAKESITKDYTGGTPDQTINQDGKTYYFYNYKNKMWANIETTSNGLNSYWVWIPRFAYKLESGTTNVILIDENDKPIDKKYGNTLPNGYTVHEAFNQGNNKLKGIWFSKYRPTKVETTE